MKKNISKEEKKIFQRDSRIKRLGSYMTIFAFILLAVAVLLSQTAEKSSNILEGRKLIALIIIIAVILFEVVFWIFYFVIQNRVKNLIIQRQLDLLMEKDFIPFLLQDKCILVFRHKDGKNFNVVAEGKASQQIKMNFDEFSSMFDGDINFYKCFVKAMEHYIKEKNIMLTSLKIKGYFPNRKNGVKEYILN